MSELLDELSEEGPEVGAGLGVEDAATTLALSRVRGGSRKAHDAAAEGFLADQRALMADQRRHMGAQLKHMELRRFSDRLRVIIQISTIAVGFTVVVGIGVATYTVSQDRSLVIEAAGAPADLVQQGWSGQALAKGLEDKLGTLEDGTSTPQRRAALGGGTIADVKVEIPSTGVSVGEAERLLRDLVGHQTTVSSELAHVTGGADKGALAFSVRVAGHPGVKLVQADGDVDVLLQRGAETIYAATEPTRYATWLSQHGRTPEAETLLRRVAKTGGGFWPSLSWKGFAV
ncbi:hypothetical protein [Phenylobacterium sp.]|uniref:hypothetical protein n=1 Tax=Phenylobacterium sp. TaxID=1871053 RepID=UPI0011F9F03F|nr:hypothetical protein [Phenylobacterium sp.]THD64878.1 MAG: hypothetical protein E8A12_07775 [Phenylobacterium sp.]